MEFPQSLYLNLQNDPNLGTTSEADVDVKAEFDDLSVGNNVYSFDCLEVLSDLDLTIFSGLPTALPPQPSTSAAVSSSSTSCQPASTTWWPSVQSAEVTTSCSSVGYHGAYSDGVYVDAAQAVAPVPSGSDLMFGHQQHFRLQPAAATEASVENPSDRVVMMMQQSHDGGPTPCKVIKLVPSVGGAAFSAPGAAAVISNTPSGSLVRKKSLPRPHGAKQKIKKQEAEPGKENGYPKPAYSYSCLIALALKNSQYGWMSVAEIYKFMCDHFPYFKSAPAGWKNSVRHNLSLNKCFEKIVRPVTPGSNQRKGCLWAMNPDKISKMDEEVAKWSRKDPMGIRRGMLVPENLESLERGNLIRDYSCRTVCSPETQDQDDSEAVSPQDNYYAPLPCMNSQVDLIGPDLSGATDLFDDICTAGFEGRNPNYFHANYSIAPVSSSLAEHPDASLMQKPNLDALFGV